MQQRLAISFFNEKLSAARYDAETAVCEIVKFHEDVDHLGLHFRVDAGIPELVDADEATLHLHAGMDGLTTASGEETDVSIEDLLVVAFERVKAAVGDVSVVVFLGESEPAVLRTAAVRAGFADIRFIDPVDAVIRKWQWSAPEQANDAMEVVCLTFHNGGLTWDRRVAADDGGFVLPGARTANGGGFAPTADGDVHSGIEAFFDWCEKTGGSRYLIVSGADETTLPPDIFAALHHHYEVAYCDALIGAAFPPYPSRYARFDEAVKGAIAAVDKTDFQAALDKYESAKAVFREEPPSDLEQLRLQLRQELLQAGSRSDLDSVDFYYESAVGLSNLQPEQALVHAEWASFYRKVGDLSRADEQMLYAYYLDPESYPENRSQGTSETTETPPNATSDSDSGQRVAFGLGTRLWWIYRFLLS